MFVRFEICKRLLFGSCFEEFLCYLEQFPFWTSALRQSFVGPCSPWNLELAPLNFDPSQLGPAECGFRYNSLQCSLSFGGILELTLVPNVTLVNLVPFHGHAVTTVKSGEFSNVVCQFVLDILYSLVLR